MERKPSFQPLLGTQCLARRVLFKAHEHFPEDAGFFLSCSLFVVLFPVGVSSFQAFRAVSMTASPDRIDENIDPPLFGRPIKALYLLRPYQLVEGDIINWPSSVIAVEHLDQLHAFVGLHQLQNSTQYAKTQ
jgi:hypothetical protein